MTFADDFESFLRLEVDLNPHRLDKLQDRVEAVTDYLAGHDTFADAFLEAIEAGSWAHRTIIRPVNANDEFDADLLFYIQEQDGWLPKDYVQKLYEAFGDSGRYKEKAERKKRCVRIHYAGDFHIDVVPYLTRGDGKNYITYRLEPEGEGRFELSDPEAFTAWMDERQRVTNGTFIKVVRLVKYLRYFKRTFECKSIIITTLLGNLVNEIEAGYNPGLYADTPTSLVTLLGKLAAWLPAEMPAVLDPAGTGDNFTDRYRDEWDYTNFRQRIIYYADKAERAHKETDPAKSALLWQEIFGDDLKLGALPSKAALAPRSASVPCAGEQFIDQAPFGFPVRLSRDMATVKLSARCTGAKVGQRSRRNGFQQFDLEKRGGRVPKNRDLHFTANVRASGSYQLYWKVRNGGDEAADRGQQRGEISPDAGKRTKTESTSYKGSHYVECYVVMGGVVVAKDRQAVIVPSQ